LETNPPNSCRFLGSKKHFSSDELSAPSISNDGEAGDRLIRIAVPRCNLRAEQQQFSHGFLRLQPRQYLLAKSLNELPLIDADLMQVKLFESQFQIFPQPCGMLPQISRN